MSAGGPTDLGLPSTPRRLMRRVASPDRRSLSAALAAPSEGHPTRSATDRILRPTLPELWTFLAVALPVCAALLATLPTVDLAYQLRAGAEILAGRGIPATDTWTFTAAGRPWLDQQWGAQAVLAAAFTATGWTGLAVLRAALVGAISGLILAAIRQRAPQMHPRTAALLTLGAFVVASPALALRPQLLGMALFAVTLLILAGRRQRPAWLWLLPAIAMVWANMHGSFILAPVLVGLACLEDLRRGAPIARRAAALTALTAAATVITPFGFGVWEYALGLATNQEVTARISEWQPPTFGSAFGALFWISVVLVALSAGMITRRAGRIPWVAVLTLGAFVVLGAVAERGIAWWPGVAVVTLAGLGTDGRQPFRPSGIARPARGSVLNSAIVVVLVLVGIALIPAWRPVDSGLNAPSGLLGQAPSGVTAALRGLAARTDRIWNPQVWGSWFEFAVPEPSYAFDARIEVIPPEAWADGDVVASAGAGWPAILDRADATIVITEGDATSPLAQALAEDSDWRLAHADDTGTIWVRADR